MQQEVKSLLLLATLNFRSVEISKFQALAAKCIENEQIIQKILLPLQQQSRHFVFSGSLQEPFVFLASKQQLLHQHPDFPGLCLSLLCCPHSTLTSRESEREWKACLRRTPLLRTLARPPKTSKAEKYPPCFRHIGAKSGRKNKADLSCCAVIIWLAFCNPAMDWQPNNENLEELLSILNLSSSISSDDQRLVQEVHMCS